MMRRVTTVLHRADPGVLLGLSVLTALVVLDVVTGVQIVGVYSAGPLLASMLTTSRRTAVVGVATVASTLVGGVAAENLFTQSWAIRAGMCLALSVLAVVAAASRVRRENRLRQMTVIAETAQRAILRSLPETMGEVGLAARYVSASAEALVGGDLYEVAATPFGVRVIVGDVRGKGLEAVQTAATVLGAFRASAFTEPDLAELARKIDAALAPTLGEEDFVTAILGSFSPDGVDLVNCGHHAPWLLDCQGAAAALDTGEAHLPLGLGTEPATTRHALPPQGRLLLFTDGLVEARNSRGQFFPLEQHVAGLCLPDLQAALDGLVRELDRFTQRRLGDDLALVLAAPR